MKHFVEGTYLKKKEGKLHIYVRSDKYKNKLRSNNYVGRTYIDGKQKIISSKTNNKAEAIKILEKWYDTIHIKNEFSKANTKPNTTFKGIYRKRMDKSR